jgi:hypothetical protein
MKEIIVHKNLVNVKVKEALCPKEAYPGYFTSDNEPDGIETATHNALAKDICFLI